MVITNQPSTEASGTPADSAMNADADMDMDMSTGFDLRLNWIEAQITEFCAELRRLPLLESQVFDLETRVRHLEQRLAHFDVC